MSSRNPSLLLRLRFALEYALIVFLYGIIRLLPHCGVKVIAKFFGKLAFSLYRPGRKLILANIQCAMPELSEQERIRIGRASMENTIFNLMEFIWLTGNRRRIERWLHLPEEITAKLKAHVANGERIIFVNPHLGSWEASGLMAPYYAGVQMAAIAKPLRNPYLNNLLNHGNREKEHGLKIIFSKGAIRSAVKALHQGLGIGTLIDQNTRLRDGGVFVNFFNMPVPSSKAPATLLRYCRTNHIPAVIVYGTSVRHEDGIVYAHARWLSRDLEEYRDDEEIIQELMDISVQYIRRYPEQYLWLYKRFLYIPEDISPEIKKRFPYYARIAPLKFYRLK